MMNLPQIHIRQAAASEEIEALRARIRLAHSQAAAIPTARPFLVITPVGLAATAKLFALLQESGISVTRTATIPDWPSVSSVLYSRTEDDERLRVAIGFKRVWNAISITQEGLRCDFPSEAMFARFLSMKTELRAALGSVTLQAYFPDVVIRAPGQVIHLHPFHAPDAQCWEWESRLLDVLHPNT